MGRKSREGNSVDIYHIVGSKLRYLREDKGFTLEQLCEQVNKKYGLQIKPNLLGKIERSQSKIQTDLFIHLCDFFEVELSFFIPSKKNKQDQILQEKLDELLQNPTGREIIRFLTSSPNQKWRPLIHEMLKIFIPQIEIIIHNAEINKPQKVLKAAKSRELL